MSKNRSPIAEVYARNPWARHPEHRSNRVLHFSRSPIQITDQWPDDGPGFAPDDAAWICCPFHDAQGAECDPMDEWGFKLSRVGEGDPVAQYHLHLRDASGKDVWLTDALNTGLPRGEGDYCLHTVYGRLISWHGETYIVMAHHAQRCDYCGEDDTSCGDYRVYFRNRNAGEFATLCAGCFAREEEEDRIEAIIPRAAIDRTMESVSINAYNFNVGLAAAQEAMGFADGGPAALFWMGSREEGWEGASYAARLDLIDEYIKYEANRLYEERVEREGHERMAAGKCVVESDGEHRYTWSDDGLEQICDSCGARRRSTDDEIRKWVEVQMAHAREEALHDAQKAVREVK